MPSSCSARSCQTGRCSASAMASACSKASRAASEVAQPGDPADDLQRLAADLGARRGRLQGCLGELAGLPEVVAGEREFGGEHVDTAPGGQAASRLFQPLRGFQVRAGDWPAGGGDRCPGELDMDVSSARRWPWSPRSAARRADSASSALPGECQAAEQQALGACPGGGVGEQGRRRAGAFRRRWPERRDPAPPRPTRRAATPARAVSPDCAARSAATSRHGPSRAGAPRPQRRARLPPVRGVAAAAARR